LALSDYETIKSFVSRRFAKFMFYSYFCNVSLAEATLVAEREHYI
jgi:hypothetical protein